MTLLPGSLWHGHRWLCLSQCTEIPSGSLTKSGIRCHASHPALLELRREVHTHPGLPTLMLGTR